MKTKLKGVFKMKNFKKLTVMVSFFGVFSFSIPNANAEFGQSDIWNFRERRLEDLINQANSVEMKKGGMFRKNNEAGNENSGRESKINIFGGSVGNITITETHIENHNGTVQNYPNFSLTQEIDDSNIGTELNGTVNY